MAMLVFVGKILVGCIGVFTGTLLIFRESLAWEWVEDVAWVRERYGGPSSNRWERHTRIVGILSFTVGALAILTLPMGIGVLPMVVALLPMVFLR